MILHRSDSTHLDDRIRIFSISILLDLYSRDIVSYTISDRPVLKMVTSMLEKAFHKIPDGSNLILHSDQGWHYQHRKYREILKDKGIRQSMS